VTFPTTPTNGQVFTLNGKTYVYNSTKGVWVVSTATSQIPTFLATSGGTITGALTVTGNVTAGNVGTNIAVITTGNITTLNNALHQNGNSNIGIAANANVTISATGTANVVSVANTGVTVTGNISLSGNITDTGALSVLTGSNGNLTLSPNGTGVVISTANLLPSANATYNLGSSTARWSTIFTTDLELSNGIGDYTVVEGEDDLFLYNNKKGKVYKFVIQEVDPKDAPPKAGDKINGI
jgi:hypothetical protein